MKKRILLLTTLALGSLGAWFTTNMLAQSEAAAKPVEQIAGAAKHFLATLGEGERAKVVYNFNDNEQRRRWSNLPTTFVRRGGLRLGDLTKAQREAALAVVAAALSPAGYEKAMEIVQGDEMLRQGGDGHNGMFGRDNYYISFLGEPSATKPWMIQFGGHHLALNVTLAGEHTTMAPSHTGSQPAIYEFEGKTVRPLGRETDKAFALLSSLDEAQRKQAILGFEMHDLVLGPGRDGEMIQPEGVKGSALSDAQQAMLLDLAGEWTGMMNESAAKAKMAELKQHVAETWFAWSGPTEKGKAAYFRIQGPTVFIEYAPQRLGGDATKHLHTIYRDPGNDYGKKWWTL
jgi:hypothetical protein